MHEARTRTCATNALFGAFILAAFGAGLLHAWAAQVRAGALTHVLIATPCAGLCAIVLYRYWRHWPARLVPLYRKNRRGMRSLDAASAFGSGMLLLTGIGMAFVIAAGSVLLLVLAGFSLGLVPWTRIAVCRDHFFVSAALVGTGAVLWLTLSAGPIPQPYYAMSALSCLCTSSLMTVFIVMLHGSRLERMPATGYGWMSD